MPVVHLCHFVFLFTFSYPFGHFTDFQIIKKICKFSNLVIKSQKQKFIMS